MQEKYICSFFRDIQNCINNANNIFDIVNQILIYEKIIQGKPGTREEWHALRKELDDICEDQDFTDILFDMIPRLEEELYTYERQNRQETSKQPDHFREQFWKNRVIPEEIYSGMVELISNYPYRHNSITSDNCMYLLRTYIEHCQGIPIASIFLPVLITIFATDGYSKMQTSMYAALKPRKNKMGKDEKAKLGDLYISIKKS